MDSRRIKPEYEAIAKRLIRRRKALQDIRDSNARIAYLESDHELVKNSRPVAGQCERIAEKYKWAIPYDFTVTVFAPNVERFTEKQIEILLYHELLHVGIEQDGNEERYYTRPHDVEDFEAIIKQYGAHWSDAL